MFTVTRRALSTCHLPTTRPDSRLQTEINAYKLMSDTQIEISFVLAGKNLFRILISICPNRTSSLVEILSKRYIYSLFPPYKRANNTIEIYTNTQNNRKDKQTNYTMSMEKILIGYILNAKNLAPLSFSIFFWFKTDFFKF